MLRFCVLWLLGLVSVPAVAADSKLSLLIVDGINNHDWPKANGRPCVAYVQKYYMECRSKRARNS
jgi:hypothetical protein